MRTIYYLLLEIQPKVTIEKTIESIKNILEAWVNDRYEEDIQFKGSSKTLCLPYSRNWAARVTSGACVLKVTGAAESTL